MKAQEFCPPGKEPCGKWLCYMLENVSAVSIMKDISDAAWHIVYVRDVIELIYQWNKCPADDSNIVIYKLF